MLVAGADPRQVGMSDDGVDEGYEGSAVTAVDDAAARVGAGGEERSVRDESVRTSIDATASTLTNLHGVRDPFGYVDLCWFVATGLHVVWRTL